MPLLNWLAVLAAIAVVVLAAAFRAPLPTPAPDIAPVGMKTLEIVQDSDTLREETVPEVPVAAEKADPAPAQTDSAKRSVADALPSITVPISVPPPAPPVTQGDLERASEKVRAALVNILCYTDPGSVKPISGTGIIIDQRGIILTVAHVAQYFLLRDYPTKDDVECIIRTGSPARTAYEAKLAYISGSWVRANPRTLLESAPSGTGENDFALLAITKSTTNTVLPDSFPYVPLAEDSANVGDAVVIGSYGAQFLSGAEVQSSLYPILVFGLVKDIYTFRNNTIDLISLGGTAAAQEGSSGGGAVNTQGELVGLITTSSVTGDTSSRDLRAITPLHVRASYRADTTNDFDSYVETYSPSSLVAAFANNTKTLGDFLISNLNQ